MLTRDTSERPFARTHCTLDCPAPALSACSPAAPIPGAARLLSSRRPPRARGPRPACPQPVPFSPGPALPSATSHRAVFYPLLRSPKGPACARGPGPSLPQCTPLRHLQPERGGPGSSRRRLQSPILASVKCKVPRPDGRARPLDSLPPPGQPCRVTRPNTPQPSTRAASEGAGAPQTSGRELLRVPEPPVPVPVLPPTPAAYRVLRLPRGSWRAPWPRHRVCGARVVALGGWA